MGDSFPPSGPRRFCRPHSGDVLAVCGPHLSTASTTRREASRASTRARRTVSRHQGSPHLSLRDSSVRTSTRASLCTTHYRGVGGAHGETTSTAGAPSCWARASQEDFPRCEAPRRSCATRCSAARVCAIAEGLRCVEGRAPRLIVMCPPSSCRSRAWERYIAYARRWMSSLLQHERHPSLQGRRASIFGDTEGLVAVEGERRSTSSRPG